MDSVLKIIEEDDKLRVVCEMSMACDLHIAADNAGIITIDDALWLELLNRIVTMKDLMNEAEKMALEIAEQPAVTIKIIKTRVSDGLQISLSQVLAMKKDFWISILYLVLKGRNGWFYWKGET